MKPHRNPLFYVLFALLFLIGKYAWTPSIPPEALLEDSPGVSSASIAKTLPSGATSVLHPSLELQWPIENHSPGRKYGWVPAAFDRTRMTFHNGVDVGARTGVPILAADNGQVYRARWMGACGNGVILLHDQKAYRRVTTTYCHLNRFEVIEGQKVARGDKVGEVGSTGRSTTPHLHLAVHINRKHTEPVRHFVQVPKRKQVRKR